MNQVTGDPAGSGITGTDLGSPVQWKNNLYFLFGDTRDTDPDQFDEHPKGFDAVAGAGISNAITASWLWDSISNAMAAPNSNTKRTVPTSNQSISKNR